MKSFKELIIEYSDREIFTKWWESSDPDSNHFDWVQDFIKDLGRDTIKRYNGDVFEAMASTMSPRQISMILKDIEKMKKGNSVKY